MLWRKANLNLAESGSLYSGRPSFTLLKDGKCQLTYMHVSPSHYTFINGCMLSSFAEYRTPLGNLEIDCGGKFKFDVKSQN